MQILFTICGRAGSKGVRNKNIREFLGNPLPYYTLSALDLFIKKNPQHECIIALNTDSEELKRLVTKETKLPVEFVKRKEELGRDDTPKIAVIADTLKEIQIRNNYSFGIVVDLDITSPLRAVKDIENLVNTKECELADVVFSVTESRRNPYFNMVKRNGEYYERVNPSQFNTRQAAPQVFDMNASLYAYSPEFLTSGKGIFEGSCKIIRMKDTGVLDIDSEEDFKLMQVIARYFFENEDEYNEIFTNLSNVIIKE
jgi:CMP-N,N'-diacetyllegionaminic acid synthase